MKIPGYQIVEELYSNSKTYVCRAIKLDTQSFVVIKYLNREYPTQNEITKVQYEYDIIKSLNLNGIVKVLSYEKANNSAMIVMEDSKARSLKQIMDRESIRIEVALDYFIRFCEILSEVHSKGVIHRDIKPHNIIVLPTHEKNNETNSSPSSISSEKIQLIDFGIAVNYFENIMGADEAIPLDGTLAYISPEQTGRMNRSVDTRTDLYSAGVLFYEVLAGGLPFSAEDSMGWVHCHIAKQPQKLFEVNPEVPEMLSAIVLKLMAKNAEDRYQTAAGLRHDLQECLKQYEKNKKIEPFPLATKDRNHVFRIPQKLYQREIELFNLIQCFDQDMGGKKQLALVSGVQGSGKSSFVLEINKPWVEKGGTFVYGKFEAYKKDEPLTGFIQAFKQWIKNVLILPQEELNLWKEKLLAALGNHGQVLINVVPDFEIIIGPQPELPELGPSELENRFYFTFLNLVQTISSSPLALVLDDLHFADLSSLRLIKLICQNSNIDHLTLVLTHNPETGNLNEFFGELGKSVKVINFDMDLLDEHHIAQLISDAIQDKSIQVTELMTELSKIVKSKTGGNPFFIKNFLNHLAQKKLIRFDLKTQVWEFHIQEIANQATTGNVVDVMLKKILGLPPNTQKVLMLASCLGVNFGLEDLQNVVGVPLNELAQSLWPAIQEGLIQTQGNDLFRIKDMELETVLEITGKSKLDAKNWFTHERLHLAAYQMNVISTLPGIHFEIAKRMRKEVSESEGDENLNLLLSHLNFASDLLATDKEKLDCIELNLKAGIKAKNATAYSLATQYLKKAIEILPDSFWQSQYTMCLQLYNVAAVVSFLNHDYNQVDVYTQVVLSKAQNLMDKVSAYDLQILKFIASDQILNATQLGLSVLKQLGVDLPIFPSKLRTGYELLKCLKIKHRNLTEERLMSLPPMTNPLELARVMIVGRIISCSFMLSQNLHVLLELYLFNVTLKSGRHSLSPFTLGGIAMLESSILKDVSKGIHYGQIALKMSDQLGAKLMECRLRFAISYFLDHWAMPIPQVIQRFHLCEKVGGENGDIEYSFYSAAIRTYHEFCCGDHLSVNYKKCEDILVTLSNYKQAQTHLMMRVMSQGVENLKSEQSALFQFAGPFLTDDEIPDAERTGNFTGIFLVLHWKAIVGAIYKKYEDVEQFFLKYEEYATHGLGSYAYYMIYFYYYLSIIRLIKKYPYKRGKYLPSFKRNLRMFRRFAEKQPENYQSKYYFLLAEFFHFKGDIDNCLEYFEKTIHISMENKFYNDQALACERMGEIFLELENYSLAKLYIEKSIRLFQQWGCQPKVNCMTKEYENLLMVTQTLLH